MAASSSSSSSCAKFGTRMMMTLIVIVVILVSDSSNYYGVDAKPKCSGDKVKAAYNYDVSQLVQQLQQEAPYNDQTRSAKDTYGRVSGKASCDIDRNQNDCLGCLAVATVDLAVVCKGRASGSSNGIGYCKMSFHPA